MSPKKKQKTITNLQFKNSAFFIKSINSGYANKRVLLESSAIYGGLKNVPPEDKGVLWEYHVKEVNNNKKQTAILIFNNRCIHQTINDFQNYQEMNEADRCIMNYLLKLIKEDHEKYNKYICIYKKAENNVKYAAKQAQLEAEKASINNISDLEKQIEKEVSVYNILKQEFTEHTDLVDHVQSYGAKVGKVHKKQLWKHKHSKYTFTWYHKKDKAQFDTSMLWKVAKQINNERLSGYQRIAYLLNLVSNDGTHNDDNAKYLSEKDIGLRVKATLATVGSKPPLYIFDNPFMQDYIRDLNPRHSTLHHLKRNQIVQVLLDCSMLEMEQILKKRRINLGESFVSASIDFWTNPHRKEQFGAFVIDFLAEKCSVFVGGKVKELFMSRETKKWLAEDIFAFDLKQISNLEFVLNFKKFSKPKTCANVADWIQESESEVTLKNSHFNQLVADGASNVIGYLVEYEFKTRSTHPNEVDFNVCHAYQNQRLGGYASGTLKFVDDPNPALGKILKKNHSIQVSAVSISLILLCFKPCN